MVHSWGEGVLGYTFVKVYWLYWVHWQHFKQDPQTMVKWSTSHMVSWVEKYICNERHDRMLFIYLDLNYWSSYHDVNILWHLNVYQNWRQYFTHGDEYFEYLLRDPCYTGQEMFIMRRIRQQKFALDVTQDAMWAYNKMHARFRV